MSSPLVSGVSRKIRIDRAIRFHASGRDESGSLDTTDRLGERHRMDLLRFSYPQRKRRPTYPC